MKQFSKLITKIKGFWKLYRDYGYDGETLRFIIENYQEVLDIRGNSIDVTCNARDVIDEIDEFYDSLQKAINWEKENNPHTENLKGRIEYVSNR